MTIPRTVAFALIATFASFVFVTQTASAIAVRIVALSGQSVSGAPSGTNVRFSSDPPSLNAAGHVAVLAHLHQNDAFLGEAILSEGSGTLRMVTTEGNSAPGQPSDRPFVNFGWPVLNAAGATAFYGITREPVFHKGFSGAWKESAGNLQLVAVDDNHAPGTAADVSFHGLINGRVLLNSAGQTAFNAFVTDSVGGNSVNESNDIGIWSEYGGALTLVAREGDQAPGTPAGVKFDILSPVLLNDAGVVAFTASITGSGSQFTIDGIWIGAPGNVQLLAREGQSAPGTPIGLTFLSFDDPGLSNGGHAAFRAVLTGDGITGSNDTGLWYGQPGSVQLLVREGDAAPGIGPGATFTGFTEPYFNAAGQAVFQGSAKATETTASSGIWKHSDNGLELIARGEGNPPGTPSGARFGSFNNIALNASGQVAFASTLVRPIPDRMGNLPPGDFGGVNETNDTGIWATDAAGVLRLIVREGDLLEIAPGDFRTLRSAFFHGNTSNGDSVPSGFNDRGQIAFYARFSDGSSGIFVTDLATVPEPSTLTLMSLTLLVALGTTTSCGRPLRRR
jgi:hypothetical protein